MIKIENDIIFFPKKTFGKLYTIFIFNIEINCNIKKTKKNKTTNLEKYK